MKKLISLTCLILSCGLTAEATAQQVTRSGPTVTYHGPVSSGRIDFKNAMPMPLPAARKAAPAQGIVVSPSTIFGPPGLSRGSVGNGKRSPVQLVPAQQEMLQQQLSPVQPEEFGTSGQPFTTSRANAYLNPTVEFYPFRAAGKLFFNIGTSTFVCSASLIKPGLVLTAAHCVANFGQSQFYSGWVFVPAYNNGTAPYGTWNGGAVTILASYFNGTDPCAVSGIVCQDDMAIINMQKQSGVLPGTLTGFFGFGYNGYSYNSSSQALISQLGYPVALDSGVLMQRNDSQGVVNTSFSNNTVIGSLMTGGSSGGPWLVNLGLPPVLSGGIAFGTDASHNIVVGVTSWGFVDNAVKQMGASPFTSGNILVLVSAACAAYPGKC